MYDAIDEKIVSEIWYAEQAPTTDVPKVIFRSEQRSLRS